MANGVYDVGGNSIAVDITVDSELSKTSTNPVENQAITHEINKLNRLVDYHDIVFSMGYIYVRNVNASGVLQLSIDGGKTWTKSIDVSSIGLIKTYYVFKDLTLNVFTHSKAYYSTDWATLHECTVLDQDGSTYVPSQTDTFTVTKTYERSIVNGIEMYVFGNYNIQDENQSRKLIWYTVDNGRTYKVAYEFNIAGARQIRHTHAVHWCEEDGTFWVLTGDTAEQSMVIKGIYDSLTDTWSWVDVGSGVDYKWASVVFYDGYFYYSNDVTPGYVKRGKLGDESDVSKHEIILSDLPNDCTGLYLGRNGDLLVTLSWWRSGQSSSPNTPEEDCRNLYYSTDRVNFVTVKGTTLPDYDYPDTTYYLSYAPNSQGKVLSALHSRTYQELQYNDRVPSVFLDEILSDAGFPFAFL